MSGSRNRLAVVALAGVGLVAASAALAQGFKFEQNPGADQRAAEAADRQQRVAASLSTPCRQSLKDKKIMVVIGEQQADGGVGARQLGLRTYTPEEIRKQVAQAEIDAYFRNDPDAALSASKRLGASFVLRGLIVSEGRYNPIVRVNEVSVGMSFTLAAVDGRRVADTAASASSFAGQDVRAMALTLLDEQADEVVSKLYSDYCRQADATAPAVAKPRK
jgi:hypothetical protein